MENKFDPKNFSSQKVLMESLHSARLEAIHKGDNKRLVDVLSQKSGIGTNIWAAAVPSYENRIDTAAFRAMLCFSVGLESKTTKCRVCRKEMDLYGDHAINCKQGKSINRIQVHDSLKMELHSICAKVGLSSIMEQSGPNRTNNQRPGDNLILNLFQDPTYVDWCVPHPLSECYIKKARKDPTHPINANIINKKRKYQDLEIPVYPAIITTLGKMSEHLVKLIKSLSFKFSANCKMDQQDAFHYTVRRFQCKLAQNCGLMLVERGFI